MFSISLKDSKAQRFAGELIWRNIIFSVSYQDNLIIFTSEDETLLSIVESYKYYRSESKCSQH